LFGLFVGFWCVVGKELEEGLAVEILLVDVPQNQGDYVGL